jgi:DNA-binding NarL/FixJ family response regulator
MEDTRIKIILVDDHPVVRQGIAKYLEKEPDIEICGEAETANEAIKIIDEKNPHLAIIDISLKGGIDGIELIKAVKNRFPNVLTLCLSMFEESVYAERAIRAGAKGYIQKNMEPDNIVKAIHRIMEGKLYLNEDIADKIISKIMHGTSPKKGNAQMDSLSNREFEVFLHIGNGNNTREIAKIMNLSTHTIESHRKNIKDKLMLADMGELNKTAIQWVLTHHKDTES